MKFFIKHKDKGPLMLRIGFFVTMITPIITLLTSSTSVFSNLGNQIGLGIIVENTTLTIIFALIYTAFLIMILIGYYARIAAGVFVIFFIFLLSNAIGTPVFDESKMWKDFALLGISLYFLFSGTGKYAVTN